MERPQEAIAQGISTPDTFLSQIGWTWRKSALIGVPPRRWLLILWPSLYRAVASGIWEITSWVEWDAFNPKLMWSVWARRPARSSLRRARWTASAVSQWPAASTESKLWHNSTNTIVPQECVGFYRVIVLLVFCQGNPYLVLGEFWESIGKILGEVHRQWTDDSRVLGEVHWQSTDDLVLGEFQPKLVCTHH